MKLQSKFIFAPVKTGYGNTDGKVTEEHLRWYERHKQLGAVIPEPFYLAKNIRELPTQIGIDSDDKIPGLQKLVDTIHQTGAKAIAHLNHPGRLANPKLPGNKYISASTVSCPSYGTEPKTMTVDDISATIKLYASAAKRAEDAGFDYLELQFGHGYLIAQFLSPSVNKRTDEYGGSFENRIRFGMEVLKAMQQASKLPIIIRLSGAEMIEGGWTIEDSKKLAPLLEQAGVIALHVSAGTLCNTPNWYYQHYFVEKQKTWEFAKVLKAAVNIPIIAIGRISSFDDVAYIEDHEMADYIALGRALVADPDFVEKYLKLNDRPLIRCAQCLDGCVMSVKQGKGLMCVVNPEVTKDYTPLVVAKEHLHYAVVGGGLAGMRAAITLRDRGHAVDLFEEQALGGQFTLAPLPPKKATLQSIIDDYTSTLNKLGCNIIMQRAQVADLIGKYDGVILATGSVPFAPPFQCEMEYKWAEVLREEAINNKTVVIVGGGLIGIEIAHKLVENDNTITIIEMLEDVARDMNPITKKLTLKALGSKVDILTSAKVTKVANNTVVYETKEGIGKISNVDILIITIGVKSNNILAEQLDGKIPFYLVGDAAKPGNALSGIQSAYNLCRTL